MDRYMCKAAGSLQLNYDQLKLHVLRMKFHVTSWPKTSSSLAICVYQQFLYCGTEPDRVRSGLGWSRFPSIMTSVVNDLRWPRGTEP